MLLPSAPPSGVRLRGGITSQRATGPRSTGIKANPQFTLHISVFRVSIDTFKRSFFSHTAFNNRRERVDLAHFPRGKPLITIFMLSVFTLKVNDLTLTDALLIGTEEAVFGANYLLIKILKEHRLIDIDERHLLNEALC